MEVGRVAVSFLLLLSCNRAFCGRHVNPVELDVKRLYIDVMNDMKNKFQNGDLNQEQKIGASQVIVETQALLGKHSFEVLGLDVGQRTSVQIFETLKAFKEAGNMTEEQVKAMQNLAEDTQVRMIQGILKVFQYIPERAAIEYNVSLQQMRLLLQRPTFQFEERRIEQELKELVTGSPPSIEGQSTTDDTLLESLSIDEEVESVVCKSEHEKCSDGTCIPFGWWCDGDEDCADASDESNCSMAARRRQQCDPDNHRRCNNGDCLPKEVWCDGRTDCSDGSDEGVECPELSCSEVGRGTQWRCRDNKRCVFQRWLCDGIDDCIDGSDEKGCSARLLKCNMDTHFQCKDGLKCVRKDWLCDNSPDCLDGSDELNCKAEESNQRQSRKVKKSEYKQTWMIVLVFSLLSASTAALLFIVIKCKWEKRGGRGGVLLTLRRFGASGEEEGEEGGQDDRIELCQA